MGFVENELSRIERAIVAERDGTDRFNQLFVAQQALKWTTEPQGFATPLDTIDRITGQAASVGNLEASTDCLAGSRPATSSGTSDRTPDAA